MNNSINNLRDNILESIQDIDCDRYINNNIDVKKLNKLYSLIRFFMVESIEDDKLLPEIDRYISIFEMFVKETSLYKLSLMESFYNPFSDDDTDIKYNKSFHISPKEKGVRISKVKLWDNNTVDKVFFDKGKMKSGKFFGKGDTIEVCPVRLIQDSDLYSRNIRDIAFAIDTEKRIYAIPFGYASYYRNSIDSGCKHNADYELIPDESPTIRIYATENIKKGSEIILFSDECDFQNEIGRDTFDYMDDDGNNYVATKNYKII